MRARPEGPLRFDAAPGPCENCPYRLDAPRKLWAPEEFLALLVADRDPIGTLYACHKRNGRVCGGWLANQRGRDFPSIALRLRMLDDPTVATAATAAHDGGHPCFPTIEAMCRANGVPVRELPDPWGAPTRAAPARRRARSRSSE